MNKSAAIILDRVNIDDHLESLHARNQAMKAAKIRNMQEGIEKGLSKDARFHSYNYQKQDAVIREWAAMPGHRAPGTFVQSKQGIRVFCINCGKGNDFKAPKVSGSGRLLSWSKCRHCGEGTHVILKGFVRNA